MSDHNRTSKYLLAGFVLLSFAPVGYGEERPLTDLEKIYGRGLPSSPFYGYASRYADAMVQHGRDTYGPQKSGLFLSALDRKTLKPLETRPPAPAGIREADRPGPSGEPLVGANPQLDENLLRVMYARYDRSGTEECKQAADDELSWFLKNTQSPATGLLPWGEHLSWNVMTDEVASGHETPVHEFARPWMLWDKCFELAPEESKRFALGLWNSQVANHETGAFDRHGPLEERAPREGKDFPRHAGFYIRTWAEAYHHTQDKTFLEAIEVMLTRFEKKRDPNTGLIEMATGKTEAYPSLTLSLAIDCDGAARKVPEPLASRLADFAAGVDKVFCALPHDLAGRKGFVMKADKATGKPDETYTPVWDAAYGQATTAMVAMMCVSRYENTGRVAYRDLITAAADIYMNSLPGEDIDAWPMTFGHAISLEVAAFRATAQGAYHLRAFELAGIAAKAFWGDSHLPRASLKSDHYEAITGADTLALAFIELDLSTLHISAVRAPANTIDR